MRRSLRPLLGPFLRRHNFVGNVRIVLSDISDNLQGQNLAQQRDSLFQDEGRLAIIGAEFRSHLGNIG